MVWGEFCRWLDDHYRDPNFGALVVGRTLFGAPIHVHYGYDDVAAWVAFRNFSDLSPSLNPAEKFVWFRRGQAPTLKITGAWTNGQWVELSGHPWECMFELLSLRPA